MMLTVEEMKQQAAEHKLVGEDIGALFYKEEECAKLTTNEAIDYMVKELGHGEFQDLFTSLLMDL